MPAPQEAGGTGIGEVLRIPTSFFFCGISQPAHISAFGVEIAETPAAAGRAITAITHACRSLAGFQGLQPGHPQHIRHGPAWHARQ